MPLAGRFGVSRESLAKLEIHVALLREWQKTFNLVAPLTLPEIWTRHIEDSLRLLERLPTAAGAIADLGSGAGFPGLVLAIASGRRVHLVESNGKKAAFLSEAVRRTGANAVVHRRRIEDIHWSAIDDPIAAVTARALAPLALLLDYAEPLIAGGAVGLFLKGREIESELTEAAKSWRLRYELLSDGADSDGVVLKVTEAKRV